MKSFTTLIAARFARRFRRSAGASTIEYLALLSLLSLVAIPVASNLAPELERSLDRANAALQFQPPPPSPVMRPTDPDFDSVGPLADIGGGTRDGSPGTAPIPDCISTTGC